MDHFMSFWKNNKATNKLQRNSEKLLDFLSLRIIQLLFTYQNFVAHYLATPFSFVKLQCVSHRYCNLSRPVALRNISNDTLACTTAVTWESEILLFYLLPLPSNHNMSPRKKMMPKNKQEKYTPMLASKTGCSRSALDSKHNTTVFTSLYILSQNMRIMVVRLNMIRGNSKKSPATPLWTGKTRSFKLRRFVSSVVLHCPENQLKRKTP